MKQSPTLGSAPRSETLLVICFPFALRTTRGAVTKPIKEKRETVGTTGLSPEPWETSPHHLQEVNPQSVCSPLSVRFTSSVVPWRVNPGDLVPVDPGVVWLLRMLSSPCLCRTPRDLRWPQKHPRVRAAEQGQKACGALCVSYLLEKSSRFVPYPPAQLPSTLLGELLPMPD